MTRKPLQLLLPCHAHLDSYSSPSSAPNLRRRPITHTRHRHFKRVCRYARSSDYAYGAATAAIPPGLLYYWEQVSPSHVGKGGFAPVMRLAGVLGACAGFLMFYQRSLRTSRFSPPPSSAASACGRYPAAA